MKPCYLAYTFFKGERCKYNYLQHTSYVPFQCEGEGLVRLSLIMYMLIQHAETAAHSVITFHCSNLNFAANTTITAISVF